MTRIGGISVALPFGSRLLTVRKVLSVDLHILQNRPNGHATEGRTSWDVRRIAVNLVEAGESPADVAGVVDVAERTVWR